MMIVAMYNKTNVSGLYVDQVMFFYSFPDRETEDNIMDYLRDNENVYDRYNYFDYEILNNCFILYTTKGFEWLKKVIDNIERIANGEEPVEIKIDPPIKVEEKKEEEKKKKEKKKMKNECPKYVNRVEHDEDEYLTKVYFGTSPKEEIARSLFCNYFDDIAIKNPDYELRVVDRKLVNRLYWEFKLTNLCGIMYDQKLLDDVIEEIFERMDFKADVHIDKEDQILIEAMPRTVDELYYWGRTTIEALKDINRLCCNDKNVSIPRRNLIEMDECLMDLEDIIDELSDLAREKK